MHGIAAALPIFEGRHSGQFVNIASSGDGLAVPTLTVCSAKESAVRAISDYLRQTVSAHIRVTLVAYGANEPELPECIPDPDLWELAIERFRTDIFTPATVASAVALAVSRPSEMDGDEMVMTPMATSPVSCKCDDALG